jgi:hypothetical protein
MKILAELPVKEALRVSLATATNARFVKANGRKFSVSNLRVFAVHGCECVRCGRKGNRIVAWVDNGGGMHVDLFSGNIMMNRDHIIPKSKKGPNSDWNYQPMCIKCNSKKGNNESAEDRELAKFRAHWRNIHVTMYDGFWKIVPRFVRTSRMVGLALKFRDSYFHKISYALAKVTA